MIYGQGRPQLQGAGGQDALPELQTSGSHQEKKDVQPGIKLWKLDGYGAFKDSVKLDTLQDYSHIFHPVYKNTITASHLGNYATPYLDNNFFNRNPGIDFYFIQTQEANLLTPQKVQYLIPATHTLMDFTQRTPHRKNETRSMCAFPECKIPAQLHFNLIRTSAGNIKIRNRKITCYPLLFIQQGQAECSPGLSSNSIQNNENGIDANA